MSSQWLFTCYIYIPGSVGSGCLEQLCRLLGLGEPSVGSGLDQLLSAVLFSSGGPPPAI